jgi:5-methylcytosine-specific restriction endonuclease McrA
MISADCRLAIRNLHRVLWRAQGRTCALCGQAMRRLWEVTTEHVVPRSAGGFWGLGNVVAAHPACNTAKADRMPTGCELVWLLAVNARLGVQPQGW